MKKQIFTLLALLLTVCSGAWAGTAIIGPSNMTSQPSGTLGSTTGGNVWYGNGTGLPSGFIIQITGNMGKAFSNQSSVTINSTSVASFKNSNGAQNTITLPSGSYASSVTFYVTANADSDAKLSECNGTSYNDAVTSHKDGANPTIITKTLGNVNSFTFTFSTKQVFFVAVVTYDQPIITTQPESATYQKDEASSALTVAATASNGELSYQWYSCDDANKTNAASIGGATNASYTPSTSANGTFYYFCRITDSKGSTDSEVAVITVSGASAPTISAAASETSVFINAAVTLTATVTGVPEPTVQWYSCDDDLKTNPVSIDGATNTTYSPSTTVSGTFYYYAVATNSEGSSSSNVVTLTVNPLYTVTYSLGEVTGTEGIVPAAVEVASSVTIPKNWLLYKDGYTLTAWNDGSADHAIGENVAIATNTTLTPVFTANGANAHLGYNATTVTWDFQTKNGAPTWQLEGNTGVQVAQTTVGGSSIDVKMDIDATSGKLNNASWTDWAQFNEGTKLTVPVLNGAVVKLYTYNEGSGTTFGGNPADSYASHIHTYTATADGDLEVIAGSGLSYVRYISVTYPSETAVLTVSAIDTKVALTKANINAVDYLSVTTDNWATGKTYAGYTGDFYNMSNTDRELSIKVTGASYFEAFVRNDNGSDDRSFKLKVGTADYVTVDAPKSTLVATGVYALDPSVTTTITLKGTGNSVYPVYFHFDPTAEIAPTKTYTTYVTSKALDFTGLELKAYVATAATTSAVTMVPVTTVPANTPLVLKKGSAASYDVPVIASADAPATNKLVASDGVSSIGGDGVYDYILSNGLFYHASAGVLPAGKAYLHLDSAPAAGARELSMSFEDEATGISEATLLNDNGKMINDNCFDLQGRKVANPTKGLYIVNGKKVIIK